MKENLQSSITRIVKTMSLRHFVLFSIAFSETVTAIMSILLRGRITFDYLVTGGIVSLLVSSVVMYLIHLYGKGQRQKPRRDLRGAASCFIRRVAAVPEKINRLHMPHSVLRPSLMEYTSLGHSASSTRLIA